MAVTGGLIFAILSAALSSFLFGYNIGVISNPQVVVGQWIRSVQCARDNGHFNQSANDSNLWCKQYAANKSQQMFQDNSSLQTVWSLVSSMFALGAFLSAMTVSLFVARFGRKGTMMLNNSTAIIGSVLLFVSYFAGTYELLIVGRIVIGLNAGINSGVPPMYLVEISPSELRGAIGTVHQLVIVFGVFIAQILGLPQILGSETGWPYLFGFSIVPAVLQIVTLFFCPESPRHLYLNRSDEEGARTAARFFLSENDVNQELASMAREHEAAKDLPKVSMLELFRDRFLRRIIIICIMVMLSQQFAGINAVMFYSTSIFEKAGLMGVESMYATIGLGGIFLVATLISMSIVEKAGRKSLLLIGLAGMLVMTVLLVTFMKLMDNGHSWAKYASVAAVMLYIILFAIGPGPIPWFIASELFTQAPRAPAMSIVAGVNWLSTLLITAVFPSLAIAMKEYVFLIFTGFLLIFVVYTYVKVPETKGKQVDEIQAEMRQRL